MAKLSSRKQNRTNEESLKLTCMVSVYFMITTMSARRILTRCRRGIFPNSQLSPNGRCRLLAADVVTLRRLAVLSMGIRWIKPTNFGNPVSCEFLNFHRLFVGQKGPYLYFLLKNPKCRFL